MFRHVLKLVWQRKAAYALIVSEIVCAFLVLFALVSVVTHYYRLYTQPLGFDVNDTWSVVIGKDGQWQASDEDQLRRMLPVLRGMEEVEAAQLSLVLPFTRSAIGRRLEIDGRQATFITNLSGDGLPEALGMQLLEGRWFGPQDQGGDLLPVVISRRFRDLYLPEQEPVGKRLLTPEGQKDLIIVGVFAEFRQYGEFQPTPPYLFQRAEGFPYPPSIVLTLEPGTGQQFEGALLTTLRAAQRDWRFTVYPWPALQREHFVNYVRPLLAGTVTVLFLMLMVGLGLLGVLWQNVLRRTREIGLRRAMGASGAAVRAQVLLELLALAAFALVVGFALVVQFPLTGLVRQMDWALFVPALLISTTILLALCLLFALYPSFLATRRDPVEALRYE